LTEPFITINGRTLLEVQAKAIRIAVSVLRQQLVNPMEYGDLMCRFDEVPDLDEDRLVEVLQIITGPARSDSRMAIDGDHAAQANSLSTMHSQRVDRILQLAGFVPEQASEVQRSLARGYASAGIAPDEAAVRLQRALEKR